MHLLKTFVHFFMVGPLQTVDSIAERPSESVSGSVQRLNCFTQAHKELRMLLSLSLSVGTLHALRQDDPGVIEIKVLIAML